MALLLNGEHISNERLFREFLSLSGGRTPEQVQREPGADLRRMQEAAERNAIHSALLLQVASQEKLTVTHQEVEMERRAAWGSTANQSCGAGIADEMSERALLRKVERHLTRHVQRPAKQEVEAIYHANKAAFAVPEQWLVSQIVLLAEDANERKTAKDLLYTVEKELAAGKAFPALAERYSDCKGNAGSLGWIARGSMVPEFEERVFSLPLRKPSEVFETVFGVHLAVVWDHKAEGVQRLEEVRAELAKQVFEERRLALLNRTVESLLRRATLQVITEPERSIANGERMP